MKLEEGSIFLDEYLLFDERLVSLLISLVLWTVPHGLHHFPHAGQERCGLQDVFLTGGKNIKNYIILIHSYLYKKSF